MNSQNDQRMHTLAILAIMMIGLRILEEIDFIRQSEDRIPYLKVFDWLSILKHDRLAIFLLFRDFL